MGAGPWGARKAAAAPDRPAAEAQLACDQCGAVLSYAPGTETLVCEYCGHVNPVAAPATRIEEQDLRAALADERAAAPMEESQTVRCSTCAASFTFDPAIHAGHCPFCGQSVVADTGAHRQIKPAAVLPFAIGEREARERLAAWLASRWLAPSKLARLARKEGQLSGVYLPYWTYDSRTSTVYSGRRGDAYMEPQRVTTTVNGKRVTQTRMVRKIRWRPVRGRVARAFDDVLVLASRSLPAWLTDRLEPWDLDGLKPYAPQYITGFQAESYGIGLEEGFKVASEKMRARIAADVRLDIGGDMQQIDRMEISHDSPSYKHILLPVWLGAFRYRGRSFRVCVNGRTGEVQGERPWSWIKVTAVVVLVALIAAAGYALVLYQQGLPLPG